MQEADLYSGVGPRISWRFQALIRLKRHANDALFLIDTEDLHAEQGACGRLFGIETLDQLGLGQRHDIPLKIVDFCQAIGVERGLQRLCPIILF